MNKQLLKETVKQLFADSKGLLAMDESTPTCNKRFATTGIPQTVEMRRSYRELIIETPGLNESIGGVILYDETIRQCTKKGIKFTDLLQKSGIIIGIKVDTGAKPMAGFPDEKITEGLDGLRKRLAEYKNMGARFAKWRGVIAIGQGIPSISCIQANVHALARYAALCQEAGIVPILEPEVLMNGAHSLQRSYDVTEQALKMLFYELYQFKVDLEGIILKPNMILAGTESTEQHTIHEVAETTVKCLLASVPAALPAIAFLSGGQSAEDASAHLNMMHTLYKNNLPWMLSFSFGRAIQQPALDIWKGDSGNTVEAQQLLYKRAKFDAEARQGKYKEEMGENE